MGKRVRLESEEQQWKIPKMFLPKRRQHYKESIKIHSLMKSYLVTAVVTFVAMEPAKD